jgi:hypothetical protein
MKPIVHGLEAEYLEQIQFTYLDVDDPGNDPFKQTLGFRYQPEFYLLDGAGTVVQKWIGPVTREGFVEAFGLVLP